MSNASDNRRELVQNYLDDVKALYGCYLDAITGFVALTEEVDQLWKATKQSEPRIENEQFEKQQFIYGTDHPSRPKSRIVHQSSIGQYRLRNELGGENSRTMGYMLVVQSFGLWEDEYRNKLATCCNVPRENILLQILGDVRLLRNSIVHHRGIALEEVKRCVILNWFREGDRIFLTPDQCEQIVIHIQNDLPPYINTL